MSTVTADRHLRLVHPAPRRSVASAEAGRSAGPTRSRPSGILHLTRRGRLVVVLVALLVVLVASAWAAQSVRASASAGASPTTYVSVAPGDTVWTIARRLHHHGDVRDVVQRIEDLNDLVSDVVRPGQLLIVPTP